MLDDSLNSSHIGPVDDMHYSNMSPQSCGRHNESKRGGGESRDVNRSRKFENPEGVLLNVYGQDLGWWDTYLQQRGTSLLGSGN